MNNLLHKFLVWIGWEKPVLPPKTVTPQVKKEVKVPKVKVKLCIFTEKVMLSESAAKEKARLFRPTTQNDFMRAYVCEFCQHWHLTHKKRYRW